MSRRLLITLILILVLPLVSSCGDDSDDTILKPDPNAYRALTLRDNVLYNLQKSWNERNIERYNELLDEGFVFFFSVADVKNGDVLVSHWERVTEMAVVGNMFDPNYSGTWAPVPNRPAHRPAPAEARSSAPAWSAATRCRAVPPLRDRERSP